MRTTRIVFALAVLLLSAAAVSGQTAIRPVAVEGESIHLDLSNTEGAFFDAKGKPFPIPPDGEEWHELSPNYCVKHVQGGYSDNDKDGCLSECDNIKLNGMWYHIRWVGYTIFCSDGTWRLENADIGNPTGPEPLTEVGRWFEVSPNYGASHSVVDWQRVDGTRVPFDNPYATRRELKPEVGDVLRFERAQEPCEVERVSVDIIVKKLDG